MLLLLLLLGTVLYCIHLLLLYSKQHSGLVYLCLALCAVEELATTPSYSRERGRESEAVSREKHLEGKASWIPKLFGSSGLDLALALSYSRS